MLIPESSTIGPIFPDNSPHYIIRVKPYYSDRLLGQWYENGKPLPDDFVWKREHGNGYVWKRDSEFTYETDLYDHADWLAHHRVRGEVYADACRLLAELVIWDEAESLSVCSPVAEEEWISVTEAAKLVMKDLGVELQIARARVSGACGRAGKFRTNGKTRTERRIEPTSFDAWRLKQRDRDLDKEDHEERVLHGSGNHRR